MVSVELADVNNKLGRSALPLRVVVPLATYATGGISTKFALRSGVATVAPVVVVPVVLDFAEVSVSVPEQLRLIV